MDIDGGCHCGAITYRATVDETRASICHCTDCQTLTGTAFRVTVPTSSDGFVVTKGTPKVYRKLADSGNVRLQGFCGDCGSHLYATSDGDGPKTYVVRPGTARQRADIVPRRQIWRRSALPWLFDGLDMPSSQKEG